MFERTCLGLLLLSACAVDAPPLRVPAPDANQFALEVYPILLRDCGFPACHGDSRRFFRVFGPGRTRLSPELLPGDPATADEVQHSYDRARSMLTGESSVAASPLLRKPLSKSAGGAGHAGEDSWGNNIYPSPQDPRYQALRAWALSLPPTGARDAGVAP
jgi:hypothetical protein